MAEMKSAVGPAFKRLSNALQLAKLGFVDIFVAQPPPVLPESAAPEDIENFAKDAMWDNLTLFGIKLVYTVENLTRVVTDACKGGKAGLKVRNLRVFSHGLPGQCRVGLVQVARVELENPESQKRKELEKLKQFLVPGISMVHIHACRSAQTEEFIQLLSKMWGNVTVRSFTDYQTQTGNQGEFFETGPTVTCTGDYCETKILPSIWSSAPEEAGS